MAGIKISALPAVSSALTTDIFPVVQAGVTSQESILQVRTLFGFDSSTGLLSMASGGTNAALTAAIGAIPYSTASAIALLAAGSSGQVFQSGGAGAPAWSTPTYPSASGSAGKILRSDGTNNVYTTSTFADTYAVSTILYASGANAVSGLAAAQNGVLVSGNTNIPVMLAGPAATGRVLTSNAAAAPSWSTATFPSSGGAAGNVLISDGTNYIASTSLWPNTVGSAGTILRSNGTSNAYSTSTFADTYGINTLLYASGANAVTGLATVTTAVLTTSSGVPTWASELSLALGGTNANLTASNGGIFYSTATAGAILAGTATANQVLLSGANGAPSWSSAAYLQTITAGSLVYGGSNNVMAGLAIGSTGNILTISGGLPVWTTSTYPATNAINTLLYASSANTMNALATANSSTLRTSSSGVPVMSTANIAISASCGLFVGGAGAGPTQITNLSVTITTLGRPVMVMLVDDGSANGSSLFASAGGSGDIYFFDGATKLTAQAFNNTATYLPVSSFSFIYTPSSGSHTITAQYSNAVNNINVSYAKLVAYEM